MIDDLSTTGEGSRDGRDGLMAWLQLTSDDNCQDLFKSIFIEKTQQKITKHHHAQFSLEVKHRPLVVLHVGCGRGHARTSLGWARESLIKREAISALQIAFGMAKNLIIYSKNRIPSRPDSFGDGTTTYLHVIMVGGLYIGKIFPRDGVSPSTLLAVMPLLRPTYTYGSIPSTYSGHG